MEELTEDYHDSKGAAASSGAVAGPGVEAPILFRRGATYYLMRAAPSQGSSLLPQKTVENR